MPTYHEPPSDLETRLIALGYGAHEARAAKFLRSEFRFWVQKTLDQPAIVREADALDFAILVLSELREEPGADNEAIRDTIRHLRDRLERAWQAAAEAKQRRARGPRRKPQPEPGSEAADGPKVRHVALAEATPLPHRRRKASGG